MAKTRLGAKEALEAQKDEHKVFDTPEEQILHRPGMWLGSSNASLKNIAVFEDGQFIDKELEIIPAVSDRKSVV